MSHTHTDGVLFSPSKRNPAFCDNIDGLGDTISEISQRERQMLYDIFYVGSETNQTHTEKRVAVASSRRRVETGEGGQKAQTSSSKFWAHSVQHVTICFVFFLFLSFFFFLMVTIWIQYPTVYLKVVVSSHHKKKENL